MLTAQRHEEGSSIYEIKTGRFEKNNLEILKVKNLIIGSKIIIIMSLNKLSQWYTGYILRQRISELKDSTEREYHSKKKEEITK